MKTSMAIDQYGNTFHDLGRYPRKALLEKFCRKHASRMFQDTVDGKTVQTGYVIAGHWLTVYRVEPWEKSYR